MPRPANPSFSVQPLLRQAAVLAGISLVLALALTLYLFGVQDQFIIRLFTAFFVFFWLLAVTFLAAVPFVNWAAHNWFGSGWADAPARLVQRKKPRAVPSSKPGRTAARPKPTNHNYS